MDVTSIFHTTFTGRGKFDGFRGQEWFDYRAGIFEQFTLKSLKKQTDQDFILWVSFRPQEKDNPVTKRIKKALDKSGIKYVMTFDGMVMYDDRATERNIDLVERTQNSLKSIKVDTKYVYETHLDSDDMLHNKFVEIVKRHSFRDKGALFMRRGYVMTPQKRVAHWYNPKAQQNYTIMFPTEIYLDAKQRYEYLNGLETHEQIPDKFDSLELPDGMFCSMIHGTNISTVWDHPFRGEEIFYDDEINYITNQFI